MGFTLEDLAAYEKKPQTQVDDKANPFDANAPAAITPVVKTPADKSVQGSATSADDLASDPADPGDGTLDDTADSSTAITDPDSGADPDAVTDPPSDPSEDTGQQPPKKGSARERIQELADERDGYREFGRQLTEHSKALREENARLRALAEGKPAPGAAKPATVESIGPMPQLDDPGIDFDPKKLADKQSDWMKKTIAAEVQAGVKTVLAQTTGQQTADQIQTTLQTRIDKFKQNHKDWDTVVKNPALPVLNPAATRVVVKSELGPEILYHLGTNVELAHRIARMEPEDQVAEIGEIRKELKEKAKTSPQPPVNGAKPVPKKTVSEAPPPPSRTPAGNRSQERDATDPGLSMDDFARRHREGKNAARTMSRKARGLR